MKFVPRIATLLTVILVVNGQSFPATIAPQDPLTVTDQERKEVQEFAKRVVEKLLKTRDVRSLIAEFFLKDFTAIPKQDFYEKVSPQLYAKLRKNERLRLFVAQENLGYIITLDVMANPDSETTTQNAPFLRILPAAVARKLSQSRLVEGTAEFTNRKELLRELSRTEKAILEARSFLNQKNLEQSPAFLRRFRRFEQDPNLGYRVRSSPIDEEVRREFEFLKFLAGQKAFSIDTPILIELIVVKEGGRFKILTIVPADDD